MTALWIAVLLQLQLPSPTGFVNDFARVIDPASRQAMELVIERVRAASGGEIVVVTLADLGGFTPIDVARDLGRRWRVGARGSAGDRARNAGVVLLLKPGRRPGDGQAELAIATGTGAEGFVTDALSGRIRDAIGQEAVATGSYASGLVLGVALVGQAYAAEFGFELGGGGPRPAPAGRRPPPPGGFPWPVILNLGFGIFFVVVVVLLQLRGTRGRRRGGFWSGMILGSILGGGGGHRGGWGRSGFGGGGFGGFGGGGGFSGGGASGRF